MALNDVPIDVVAERLGSTRGALYKTIHDARRKLKAQWRGSSERRISPSRFFGRLRYPPRWPRP